jgi:S-adenosylmethionine synthetase
MMQMQIAQTAEHVSEGHPDKFCDQVADRILDTVLQLAADDPDVLSGVRTAIECLAKDNLLIVSGEVKLTPRIKAQLDIVELARSVWKDVGYGDNVEELTVINHVRTQSKAISKGEGAGVDAGGAGDQGIMVGYATNETPELMPREWVLARDICLKLRQLRIKGILKWLKSDCKSQVTLNEAGEVVNVVVAAQHVGKGHEHYVTTRQLREEIRDKVLAVVLPGVKIDLCKINGTGAFDIGGPTGDAGVVGRKIVVDAYGPRIPVGGGAYSGKDPTKVDRSAAYMARLIAKTAVTEGEAKECLVRIAYGIGRKKPEMVTAVTETGKSLASWLDERFPKEDLWPVKIIERLGLRNPKGWSYFDTAAYGHYGRTKKACPWEQVE